MCKTPKQWGYAFLAAVFGALFAWLFIATLVQQFVNRGVLVDGTTATVLAQYFVAFVLLGIAKHCKWKTCEDAPARKKK